MKQPLLVQQGKKELLPDWHWDNYIMGFAKPIEQYLFGNLLTEIQVIMYLKDIIRGVRRMNNIQAYVKEIVEKEIICQ